jgi:hypothetical protein
MRLACIVAIGLMLPGIGTLAAPQNGDGPRSAPQIAPVAAIDLGGTFAIFGIGDEDENEADEDEPDEGGGQGGRSAASEESSAPSLPVVLLVLAAGAIVVAFVVSRVRRLWFRLRDWAGGLTRTRP